MRKTFGLMGIAAMLLTGCSETSAEEPNVESATHVESLKVFGSLSVDGDKAVLMGEDEESCMIAEPSVTAVVNNLETVEVTIENAEGSVVAVTEFQTDFSEEVCSWYIETEVEADSEHYVANFGDMSTPAVQTSEAVDGTLTLDLVTPVADKADGN